MSHPTAISPYKYSSPTTYGQGYGAIRRQKDRPDCVPIGTMMNRSML